MKQGIHPDYKKATVVCACGNSFETNSTAGDLKVEVCSNCHPFFTGVQKFLDTDGRVEKFKKRAAKSTKKEETKA
jgi:large subunit ribosomal protein L31